jgi:hypothetical protein
MNRTIAPGLLLVGLFTLLQSTTSRGQEAIGSATSVKPQAEANSRMLAGGSTVYSKELIHTGDAGVADLRFHDNSNLSVGPKSSVRLDKFVYDPNKSAGSAMAKIVHDAKVRLCGSIVLLGCSAKPLQGLRIVLRHAQALAEHDAEVPLCGGIALVGCFSIPLQGLAIVLWHAVALNVY